MGLYAVKSVKVTNVRGFSIELATSLVVIVAARFGERRAAPAAPAAPSARARRAGSRASTCSRPLHAPLL